MILLLYYSNILQWNFFPLFICLFLWVNPMYVYHLHATNDQWTRYLCMKIYFFFLFVFRNKYTFGFFIMLMPAAYRVYHTYISNECFTFVHYVLSISNRFWWKWFMILAFLYIFFTFINFDAFIFNKIPKLAVQQFYPKYNDCEIHCCALCI